MLHVQLRTTCDSSIYSCGSSVVAVVCRAHCAQIGTPAQLVAVGCSSGDVKLFNLFLPSAFASHSTPSPHGSSSLLVRTLHLGDWGYTPGQVGGISALAWAPDCRALAVGYARQGFVVWSPSGCRLLCTMRQPIPGGTPRISAQTSGVSTGLNAGENEPAATPKFSMSLLEGGVQALAWGPLGYQLLVAEVNVASRELGLVECSLAKSLPSHHRVAHMGQGGAAPHLGDELHVLQVRVFLGGGGLGTGLGFSIHGSLYHMLLCSSAPVCVCINDECMRAFRHVCCLQCAHNAVHTFPST